MREFIFSVLAFFIFCLQPLSASAAEATVSHGWIDINGVNIHYVSAGHGEPIIFVHGFPEFWLAWENQIQELSKDHKVIAIDMRGFNLSSKPKGKSQYQISVLIEDLKQIAEKLNLKGATWVAHDWGGIVTWGFAIHHPEWVKRLIILNSPHPAILARELQENPVQRKAGEYVDFFRTPFAKYILSAFNFKILDDQILQPLLNSGFLSSSSYKQYLQAWAQEGALNAALNYYRAADFVNPSHGRKPNPRDISPQGGAYRVRVPTMVIWGEQDKHILLGNLVGLPAYVDDLRVERVPDATHWIAREKPKLVNFLIRDFIQSKP